MSQYHTRTARQRRLSSLAHSPKARRGHQSPSSLSSSSCRLSRILRSRPSPSAATCRLPTSRRQRIPLATLCRLSARSSSFARQLSTGWLNDARTPSRKGRCETRFSKRKLAAAGRRRRECNRFRSPVRSLQVVGLFTGQDSLAAQLAPALSLSPSLAFIIPLARQPRPEPGQNICNVKHKQRRASEGGGQQQQQRKRLA